METQNSSSSRLTVSDRISVVNALMVQDRQEVRSHQDALLKLSYLMVPAFIAVAAFYDAHRSMQTVLIIGHLLLLLLYIVVYLVTFLRWLPDARACLNIRESYFDREQADLYTDPFRPLRGPTSEDYRNSFIDRYLWFPFGVTVVVASVTLVFLIWL
jgi:hypothetical protein